MVGLGWARRTPSSSVPKDGFATSSTTLGPRNEQNPYTAELAAIAEALYALPPWTKQRIIVVVTNNKAAALTLRRPRQQSGQVNVMQVYKALKRLRKHGNILKVVWKPMKEDFPLAKMAKMAARKSTEQDSYPEKRIFRAKSTTLNLARKGQGNSLPLPEGVGAWSKRIDIALPGRHTRMLYDPLRPKEAGILAQLRTGMIRLNYYLHQIGAAPSDQCACGQERETIGHFLFRCDQWMEHRTRGLIRASIREDAISHSLGGKSEKVGEKWEPDLAAVKATIKYAIATGRLVEE
jgi:hypothetical protein